jgi:hypothetical protein
MIRIPPKPSRTPIVSRKPERLPKRKRMTLAVGMHCKEGLILAADTLMSYSYGPISEGRKLDDFTSASGNTPGSGTYAIAQSSEDTHAADTLISEIRAEIQTFDPKTFSALEPVVKAAIAKWYAAVYENRPTIQLLLGACLSQETEPALYFCEPPSTVSRVWETCKTIGEARAIADPIHSVWFKSQGSLWPCHTSLCQISYMMYKAKQLFPGSVGGDTDVVILGAHGTAPCWVERASMEVAEGYGRILDRYMSRFVSLLMAAGSQRGGQGISRIAESVSFGNLSYAALEFRCQFPCEIIRHEEFYT